MNRPTILLVDVDPATLDVLANALIRTGFTVRTANDGERALYLANGTHPALVVADIATPGLNGIVLARRLRQVGIPVILTSAGGPILPPPGIDYLPKPIDLTALRREVRRALRARHGSDRAPYLPPTPIPACRVAPGESGIPGTG